MADNESIIAIGLAVIALLAAFIVPLVTQTQSTQCANTQIMQCGSDTCTTASAFRCSKVESFSPAFVTTPKSFTAQFESISGGGVWTTFAQTSTIYAQDWFSTAIVFDKSALTSDALHTTNPFTYTISVTPAQTGELGVLMIYIVNTNGGSTISITSVTDSQLNTWSSTVAFTLDNAFAFGGLAMYTATLATTTADTISIVVGDTGTVNDFAGATVELFQKAVLGQSAVSGSSVTVTTGFPNDFVVGGAELSVTVSGVCDSLTLSAPTTTRQSDANCATNKAINFASGDQHPASDGSQTFAAVAGNADGGVIAAVALEPSSVTGGTVWNLSNSVTELFGDSQHEVFFPGLGIGTLNSYVLTMHFTCFGSTNPLNSITVTLYQGTTATSTITGTAASLCNDVDQTASGFATQLTGLYALKASCPSCTSTVYISMAYFIATSNAEVLPTVGVSAISASSMTVQCTFIVKTSTTCNWNWNAQE